MEFSENTGTNRNFLGHRHVCIDKDIISQTPASDLTRGSTDQIRFSCFKHILELTEQVVGTHTRVHWLKVAVKKLTVLI